MNKRSVYALLSVAALFGSVPKSSFGQEALPSLSETLAWIDSSYNDHSREGGGYGHGEWVINDSGGKLFKRKTETLKADGCFLSLSSKDDPDSPLFSKVYGSYKSNVNLHDIDPKSISIRLVHSLAEISCDISLSDAPCDRAVMSFETRNQAALIEEDTDMVFAELRGNDRESKGRRKTFVASIYFDNIVYAGRFEKAFRHAIDLCGGRPSPF